MIETLRDAAPKRSRLPVDLLCKTPSVGRGLKVGSAGALPLNASALTPGYLGKVDKKARAGFARAQIFGWTTLSHPWFWQLPLRNPQPFSRYLHQPQGAQSR